MLKGCESVCVCVFTMGVPSSVLPTRAGTKKEHTPPFSQVPSIMTGKVIDYTPRWADRAKRALRGAAEAQEKARKAGERKRNAPITHHRPERHLSLPLINFSWESSLTHNVRGNNSTSSEEIRLRSRLIKNHSQLSSTCHWRKLISHNSIIWFDLGAPLSK